MALLDLFRQAKEIRTSIEQQVDKLEAERNKLRAELKAHESNPRPQADLAQEAGELVDALISRAKAEFNSGIEKKFNSYTSGDQSPVSQKVNYREFSLFTNAADSSTVSIDRLEPLLYLVAGDRIKEVVVEAVNAMPYPAKVGLPLAERASVLADLRARIKSLDDQLRELMTQADEAGISF